jgi:hypothetical protein
MPLTIGANDLERGYLTTKHFILHPAKAEFVTDVQCTFAHGSR